MVGLLGANWGPLLQLRRAKLGNHAPKRHGPIDKLGIFRPPATHISISLVRHNEPLLPWFDG